MGHDWLTAVLAVLLGTGGIGSLVSVARGINSLRSGVRARQREAITDLARSRDKADERADSAELDRDFWRGIAGRYAYQLTRCGQEPAPPDPVPPSERRRPGTV